MIGCMFVKVVTELEICHIYEVVLRTIKLAAHNLSGASNFTAKTGCMTITSREGMNQSKIIMFIIEIDLTSSCFS
jgi:hypothetical protein